MQTVPENWERLFTAPHKTEYKLIIGGTEYGIRNIKGVPTITKPLLEKPAIGRVCSATLTVTVIPYKDIPIPKSARIFVYCRLVSPDDSVKTEWIPQGRFYISSRSGKNNVTLTARDEMLKSGQTYFDKTNLDFPASHTDVVNEIAGLMNVSIDSRTSLLKGESYMIENINGNLLMSEVLSGIAACNGGNWIITEEGRLRLIPLKSPSDVPEQRISGNYKDYTNLGNKITVSRVTMLNTSIDEEYTSGNDSGYEIYVECPYANQDIADFLGNPENGLLYGVTYQPFQAQTVFLNPLLQPGDTVTFKSRLNDEINVVLHSVVASCTVGFSCEVSSHTDNETEDEYPYQTPQEISDSRNIKTNKSYYGNSINREYGFRSKLDSGAYAQFNADGLEFVDESGRKCLYYDAEKKTFVMDGTLGANAIFSNAIFASQGEIADLTVNQLSTSRRIKKFLLKDTSDDNYILIKGYSIQFITGVPVGRDTKILTENEVPVVTEDLLFLSAEEGSGGNTDLAYEQAVNQHGEPLYWQKDISNAAITEDGAPYVDGVKIFTTTEVTDYPAYVYVYDELVKSEYRFRQDTETDTVAPVQIWGAGTGYGDNGKGFIEKVSDGFSFRYQTRQGIEEYIKMGDDGFIDIDKMRRPVLFDFSGMQPDKDGKGTFTEVIDGDFSETYTVSYNEDGYIQSITSESGHRIEVIW